LRTLLKINSVLAGFCKWRRWSYNEVG